MIGFLPFFILFALGAMGAGDVKLLAGLGAWLGPGGLLTTLAWASILFFLVLLLQGELFRALANIAKGLYHLLLSRVYPGTVPSLPRSRKIPFGVYLSLGALVALWMEGGLQL
jgi:prepilin peptidase CpaA